MVVCARELASSYHATVQSCRCCAVTYLFYSHPCSACWQNHPTYILLGFSAALAPKFPPTRARPRWSPGGKVVGLADGCGLCARGALPGHGPCAKKFVFPRFLHVYVPKQTFSLRFWTPMCPKHVFSLGFWTSVCQKTRVFS